MAGNAQNAPVGDPARRKVALITGITGQDGSYLAELLLSKGYIVSIFQTFFLHYGDLTDSSNLSRLVSEVKPDEIYNLAAQSHVQASTSELYGKVQETPQKETTPFYPRSPYGCAKLYSYWIVVNYREAYGMYACNGILFNHESPRRGETFVTRKITRAVARIKHGMQELVELGNLNAKRDWGYAEDYVYAMWLMLQQKEPVDYVIASGETHTVREFVEKSFAHIGKTIVWEGHGVDEVGKEKDTGIVRVRVNPHYFRPTDVDLLIGDCSRARKELNWQPKVDFENLIKIMVDSDLEALEKSTKLKR
ncbi:hypothetical protein AAHC03_012922 [Spirometra sp. Aus1]